VHVVLRTDFPMLLFLLIAHVVCSTFQANKPLPRNLIPIPLYRQQTGYSCGPSSGLSLLRYWDWRHYANVTEQDLYPGMNCTTDGTDPGPIAAYFSRVGLPAKYLWTNNSATLDIIQDQIDHGFPVIVDFQAWQDTPAPWWSDWDDGHYNVLVGYDKENLFFMDPSTDDTYAYIPKLEFLERWHDGDGPDNVRKYHMAILIKGSGSPHPVRPRFNFATYEA